MLSDFIPVMMFGILCVLVFLLFEIYCRDKFLREKFFNAQKKHRGCLFFALTICLGIIILIIAATIITLSEGVDPDQPTHHTPSSVTNSDTRKREDIPKIVIKPEIRIEETKVISEGFQQTDKAE